MPLPATDRRTGSNPDVSATVRLLHRRRGWAWTCVASLVAVVVYAVIGSHLFPDPTGALAVISGLVLLALLALAAAGLIVAVVDTVRLHGQHVANQAQARAGTSHHPVLAHGYRYPPRHKVSGWFGRIVLAFWLVLSLAFLPNQVNAVAYLTHLGPAATFFPASYGQDCGRYGCSTITNGTLLATGSSTKVPATWSGQVPLYVPFTVRAPVWNWGKAQIVSGGGDAAGTIAVGLLFDFGAVIALIALVTMVRHWLRRRREAAPFTTATA